MKKFIGKLSGLTMGLDVGDRTSYAVVLDSKGEIAWEGKLTTRPSALQKQLSGLDPMVIALEAGSQSMWISRLLLDLGHEVIVANPRKVRLIYENKSKQDRVDAWYLARLARVDPQLLHPIHHRNKNCQVDLQLIRSRDVLVRTRTLWIAHIRSAVKTFGGRLPSCSAPSFARKMRALIPEELADTVHPLLDQMAAVTQLIKQYDKRVERLCETRYPETEALLQIQGVGPLTALAFVLTLEDPARFKKSRSVGSFLGLCPKRSQSSSQDPQLRIHKQGDRYLRHLLVHCAHYILGAFGEDCDLRRHGEKIAQRGGKNAKKRAVVAVARKLSVLMYRLWKTQELYDPLYNSKKRAA